MNADDLWLAWSMVATYRAGVLSLRDWHDEVYTQVSQLRGTAPEVWLSCVMQLAKG